MTAHDRDAHHLVCIADRKVRRLTRRVAEVGDRRQGDGPEFAGFLGELPEFEQPKPEMYHRSVALEISLPHERGHEPRHGGLRQGGSRGELGDAQTPVILVEGFEDGGHAVEYAERVGVRCGSHRSGHLQCKSVGERQRCVPHERSDPGGVHVGRRPGDGDRGEGETFR